MDIQVKNERGSNAFWIACLYGHGNLMKLLSETPIDMMCTNIKGINVFHLAVIKNYVKIVQMLLDTDFLMDIETNESFTAL